MGARFLIVYFGGVNGDLLSQLSLRRGFVVGVGLVLGREGITNGIGLVSCSLQTYPLQGARDSKLLNHKIDLTVLYSSPSYGLFVVFSGYTQGILLLGSGSEFFALASSVLHCWFAWIIEACNSRLSEVIPRSPFYKLQPQHVFGELIQTVKDW
ncbi:hypothetical protein J6590_042874 [Homalodisca vitripennis]|nr:hypothetical protein J6590_042874 [Homalodisca vitripennis]